MSTARPSAEERKRDTQRVTLVGAVINLVLAVMKVVVGWLAHSHSLVADGIHSLSDLLSDGLVWFAAHHAAQAPDQDHPYGHGRFEALATLGLGILLLLVALGIVWDAVERLFSPDTLQIPGAAAVIAAVASIVVKEWLYRYTMRVAKHHKSAMLRANAWHHRTDSVSSVVVLVGVTGTMAGLPYLDALAAAGVGLMIAHIAWELGRPAIRELSDAALEEERVKVIQETIMGVSGVEAIHMLRTRKSAGRATMDVHVLVAPWISVSEGHMIGQEVTDRLLGHVDELSDVTVHVDPEDDEIGVPSRGLPLRDEAEAALARAWEDLPEYGQRERVLLHYLDGQIDVDVQFPMRLFQGEDEADALKERLRARLESSRDFRGVTLSYLACAAPALRQ